MVAPGESLDRFDVVTDAMLSILGRDRGGVWHHRAYDWIRGERFSGSHTRHAKVLVHPLGLGVVSIDTGGVSF